MCVNFAVSVLTVVQVAGDGGMGEDEVELLLLCGKISSSKCECPGGEVATSDWAGGSRDRRGRILKNMHMMGHKTGPSIKVRNLRMSSRSRSS